MDARRWKGFDGTQGHVLPSLSSLIRRHFETENVSPFPLPFWSSFHTCVQAFRAVLELRVEGRNLALNDSVRDGVVSYIFNRRFYGNVNIFLRI